MFFCPECLQFGLQVVFDSAIEKALHRAGKHYPLQSCFAGLAASMLSLWVYKKALQ